MDRAFGKLNRKATEEAFKQYLLEWKDYRLKALQKMPTVGSPLFTGQPNDGTPHDPDVGWASYADEMRHCREREDCCHRLETIGEEEHILADLLLHRYIKRWGAIRTMMYLNDEYNLFWDDRKYRRQQSLALWEGALICQDETVRVPKIQ